MLACPRACFEACNVASHCPWVLAVGARIGHPTCFRAGQREHRNTAWQSTNRGSSANQRKLAAQQKYVTTYQLPPMSQIPVAPEGDAASTTGIRNCAGDGRRLHPGCPRSQCTGSRAARTRGPSASQRATCSGASARGGALRAAARNALRAATPRSLYVVTRTRNALRAAARDIVVAPPIPTDTTPILPYPQASEPALRESAAPSPNSVVALPPYALVPVAQAITLDPALEHQLWAAELAISGELAIGQLRERKSIGGPIVGMVLGYGGTGCVLHCRTGHLNAAAESGSDTVKQYNQDTLRRTAYAFTGLAAVGTWFSA